MTENVSLPFELSSESLNGWLNSLNTLAPASAANQLNRAIKQLNSLDAPAATVLPLLINLTPLTLHLSNALYLLTRAEPDILANSKTLKIAKLSIQLLRHLALGFCRVAESRPLDAAPLQMAIFYGLQLAGHCLRGSSLFYEMPSATLWKKSGVLYTIAAKHHLLHEAVSVKPQEFKQLTSIEAVIKRNLLFAICMPCRYANPDIIQLFQLANQHQQRLQIGTQPIRDYNFYWDLNNQPCPAKRAAETLPSGSVSIISEDLGNALQLGEIQTALKPGIPVRLGLHLVSYRNVFKSVEVGPVKPAHLLEGFVGICAQLQGLDKLSKIMNLSAQTSRGKPVPADMTLIPLEHEKSFFKPLNAIVTDALHYDSHLNLLRTNSKQFLVAESAAAYCLTGDLALLCRDQQPSQLVIIRQQGVYEDVTLILLEPIIGSLSICDVIDTEKTSQKALLISAESDSPEVVLASGKYGLGSKITAQYDKSFFLKACMESNAYFARFKISFEV